MKALSFLSRGQVRLTGVTGLALGLALAVSAAGCSQAPGPDAAPASEAEAARDRLSDAFDALEAAGFTGIVGISQSGETLLMRGAGAADPQTGRPYGPDTQVDIGSYPGRYRFDHQKLYRHAGGPADQRGHAVGRDTPG